MIIFFAFSLLFVGVLIFDILQSYQPKLTANQRILAGAARIRARREAHQAWAMSASARNAGEVSE